MGGGSKSTTQETKVEPWSGAKPHLLDMYENYAKAIENGQPQYYQGSTIAGQSDATKSALQQMLAYANNPNATNMLNNATTATNNIIQNGGQNQQANSTISQLMNGLNLGSDPSTAGLSDLISKSANNNTAGNSVLTQAMNGNNPGLSATQNAMAGMAGGNPTSKNLGALANGSMVGNNPYLSQMVSNQQDAIADKLKNVTLPGLQGQAASAGRSGSGAFASLLNNANATAANEMAKVATDMYGNQYNNDINTMLTANNQLSNNYNADTTNNLNAASQLGQQYLAGTDQKMNAANNLTNSNNANSALMQSLFGQQSNNYQNNIQNLFNNAGLKLNAANSGSANSQNAANTSLNAATGAGQVWQNGVNPANLTAGVGEAQDIRSQDELNAKIQEWDFNQQSPLQQYANFINLLNGGGYNNSTSVTTQKTSGGLGGILGGLTSGLGLLSKIPGLCDKRLKENIKYLGDTPTGIKMYSFNYINDNETYIGPMAQEVQETNPELVGTLPDGTLFVRGEVFGEAA